jgi:protease I
MPASGKRVAIVLANNFEDIEATSPIEAVQAAGATTTVIGIERGRVTGKKGAEIEATHAFDQVSPDDFDMLIIPGGGSPENLRIHEPAVAFTRQFVESRKPVASICHGPQLLISAKIVAGRRLSGVNKIRDDIANAGAIYVDEAVSVDGNLISSRVPDDLPQFNQALVDALQ